MFDFVKRIDFTKDYGNWSEDLMALYNENVISEEEVVDFINSGSPYNKNVIVCYPCQFDSVFGQKENK